MTMTLNQVIPWGRSFKEYRRIFALSAQDLAGVILGCGDGPASFNAEATRLGHCIVSCDPVYCLSAAEIRQRVQACRETVIAQVKQHRDGFLWDFFRDPDHLAECRFAALERFLADFDAGRAAGRYVTAALPTLPFANRQFSLAVVSHLLFLYSDQFDLDFHIAAVEELLRVAGELRVFPLVTLQRRWSPHVRPVIEHLHHRGFKAEVTVVDYEFQKADDHAGNRTMRVRRAGLDR